MKSQSATSHAGTTAVFALICVCIAGCGGSRAEGHSYSGNGGVVKVEFKSDGQAYLSMGPLTMTCSYSESGKTLALTCDGDKTDFTFDDDGALIGPRDGMLARLTKEK